MYHCISYYISAVASHTNMWHKEMKVNHKTYKLQFILTYFIWRIIYTSVERTWSYMSMNQVCIRNDKLQIPIKVNINGKYSCTRILIHVYIAKVHNIHCLSLATHEVVKLKYNLIFIWIAHNHADIISYMVTIFGIRFYIEWGKFFVGGEALPHRINLPHSI